MLKLLEEWQQQFLEATFLYDATNLKHYLAGNPQYSPAFFISFRFMP